ncbi:hypothetical protein [Streptomyces sp. CB02400]|uniref:hypothetical protein n=1 Tax=Streptomyces sp. CB02400 TaxID=1703944 RepID=UPI002E10029D
MRDSPVEADMEQDTSRPSDLPQPLRAVASGLRHLPGAEQVGRVTGGALDAIGAVSPRGRRMAVYAGAGVLGVAGVVEWPVALTGAAVAWLTQPRPAQRPDGDGEGLTQWPAGEPDAEPPADADGRHGTPADRPPTGPGDRLTPSRDRTGRTEHPVHDQPAKVGDTATASALKQVADATRHHGAHLAPRPDRGGRAEHPVGDEPARAGDTASALEQDAGAARHHGTHPDPSRDRGGRAESPVREQPAEVGGTAEQVAGAARHHGTHPDPDPDRDNAPGQSRDARHTG